MNNRIKEIMAREHLTSQRFAQKIGIQPSAVSHILSGRNKPSLDVALKILNTFSYINTDWLIKGIGPMLRKETESSTNQHVEVKMPPNKPQMASLFSDDMMDDAKYRKEKRSNFQQPVVPAPEKIISQQKQPPINQVQRQEPQEPKTMPEKRVVKRIIIYYSDNTFEEYNVC